MLRQATAVLVALAALVAADLDPVALLALLESLTVAGTPLTSLLELGRSLVGRAVVRIVLDGATIELSLRIGHRLMVWKAGWRGGKAANEGRPGSGALGHSAATVCNRHSGGPVTIPEGSG